MIIILFLVALALIIINIKAIKSEDKNNFENILINKEQSTNKVDIEILKIRKDLSETIIELQREIVDLKEEVRLLKLAHINSNNLDFYNNDNKNVHIKINNNSQDSEEIIKKDDNKLKENKNTSNVLKVKNLIELGIEDDEICRRLQIGKGELLLIKDLYK
ncbi:hypothetical protein [Clostridium mediterraneense]|uniref:hypothetical protein n=1 Tax=Clostridium mediterraneense TaxID=1805472 RepID=UPI0009FDAFFD|nr:hypothetical protein [Clostridium mediterraneense]